MSATAPGGGGEGLMIGAAILIFIMMQKGKSSGASGTSSAKTSAHVTAAGQQTYATPTALGESLANLVVGITKGITGNKVSNAAVNPTPTLASESQQAAFGGLFDWSKGIFGPSTTAKTDAVDANPAAGGGVLSQDTLTDYWRGQTTDAWAGFTGSIW